MSHGFYYTCFSSMCWGFAFVFIDINVNRFDIMHDAIGYGIILYSLLKLAENPDFFRASFFTLIALLLSLFRLSESNLPFQMADSIILLDIALLWNVCAGVSSSALVYKIKIIQVRSANVRAISFLLLLLLIPLPLFSSVIQNLLLLQLMEMMMKLFVFFILVQLLLDAGRKIDIVVEKLSDGV